MSAAKKFWDLPAIPPEEMFTLDTIQQIDGHIIERMQWEGRTPERGIAFLLHYWNCESCRKTAVSKGGTVALLSKGHVLVASIELKHNLFMYNSEYSALFESKTEER